MGTAGRTLRIRSRKNREFKEFDCPEKKAILNFEWALLYGYVLLFLDPLKYDKMDFGCLFISFAQLSEGARPPLFNHSDKGDFDNINVCKDLNGCSILIMDFL